MATYSSVLAWRIPGTGKPGGLPSMGSHRVGHDWSDLAAAATERMNEWQMTELISRLYKEFAIIRHFNFLTHFTFLTAYFLKSSFSFTTKLRGRPKDFSYKLCPHTWITFPIINILPYHQCHSPKWFGFFFFFLATQCDMWDLNSLTRDQTYAPFIRRSGKSPECYIFNRGKNLHWLTIIN